MRLPGLWTLVKKKITKHKISYIALWRTYRKIVKVFQWILPWSSSIPAGLWTASAILSKNTNININTEEIIIKIYDEIIFIHLIIKLHKLFPCFLKENFTYLWTMVERIIHVNLFRMGTFQLVTILRRAFQYTSHRYIIFINDFKLYFFRIYGGLCQ